MSTFYGSICPIDFSATVIISRKWLGEVQWSLEVAPWAEI